MPPKRGFKGFTAPPYLAPLFPPHANSPAYTLLDLLSSPPRSLPALSLLITSDTRSSLNALCNPSSLTTRNLALSATFGAGTYPRLDSSARNLSYARPPGGNGVSGGDGMADATQPDTPRGSMSRHQV